MTFNIIKLLIKKIMGDNPSYNYLYGKKEETPAKAEAVTPANTKPLVSIGYMAKKKLMAYIKNVGNEVGGIGKITRDGNTITIEDVYLIEQEVTGASTILSPEGMAKFYDERMAIEGREVMSQLKLWWHSHANMAVFWSGTDDATINSFDQETEENNWMLSLVGNHKGDIKIRLDIYRPYRYTIDNIDFYEDPEPVTEFDEAIKLEIAEKVKEPARTQTIIYTGKDKENRDFDWENEDDDDLDKNGLPYAWRSWTKSERKDWKKLNRDGKRKCIFSYVSDDGSFKQKYFIIPIGRAVVAIIKDKDGKELGYHIPKLKYESDLECKRRYEKAGGKAND